MKKEHLRTAGVCLLLALGTALLYAPVLHFDFLKYDDQIYVVNNPRVNQGLHWASLGWCFQAGYATNWHPLTWMSHMLDCQLFGLRPAGHHATNIILHTLNAVLLFLVLRTMTGAFWRSAVVAALFAWHPLHVESVAWVAERKDVLSTLFWMLTMWAYICYARRSQMPAAPPGLAGPARGSRAMIFYGLALLLFALGLMAKPMLVTLPCVLLLLDWWPLGRLQPAPDAAPGSGSTVQRALLLFVEKIPFFALAMASSVVTLIAQRREGIMTTVADTPLRPRIIDALAAIAHYLEKTVWPADLGVIYPFVGGWPLWKIATAAAGLVLVTAMAVRWRRSRPYWLLGWLWFLGTLTPVLDVFNIGASPMSDRYTYIPLIGLFLIAAWDVYDLAGQWRYHQWILGTITVIVLGACMAASRYQLGFWQNTDTLFSRIARSNINSVAHAQYAAILMHGNRLEQAEGECARAVQIAPASGPMHALLGRILFLEGKPEPATEELRFALRLEPELSDARLQLGDALLAQKLPVAAAFELATLLKVQPANVEAHFRLGQALMMSGKFDDAAAQFNEVLRLGERSPEAHLRDEILRSAQRSPDAHFSRGSLPAAPRAAEAHFSLALLAERNHNTAGAIGHYQAALQLRPDYPEALNNLAWILASAAPQFRNGAQAVQLAQRACQLTRNEQPAIIGTLAAAYAESGEFDEAAATAKNARDVALARGDNDVAARNLQLMERYRAGKKVPQSDQ